LRRSYRENGGAADGDGAHLAGLARAGDRAAAAAWQAFSGDLGLLCEIVIALLEPEVIVIGGSLAQARDLLQPALHERLSAEKTRVAWGELGPFAGVIGAAALARFRVPTPAYPADVSES
jgi:glucokinase